MVRIGWIRQRSQCFPVAPDRSIIQQRAREWTLLSIETQALIIYSMPIRMPQHNILAQFVEILTYINP